MAVAEGPSGLLEEISLRETGSAMSALASMVSLGSRGSPTDVGAAAAPVAVEEGPSVSGRGRLAVRAASAAVSPSSAEASRDSGWMTAFSSTDMAADGDGAMSLRLRFVALCEGAVPVGEDIVGSKRGGGVPRANDVKYMPGRKFLGRYTRFSRNTQDRCGGRVLG